jgi:uncharacterized coiled-coil protein SlyX
MITLRAMTVETEDKARETLAKRQDTLTSAGPEPARRSSSPDIDVVPARPPLDQRTTELEQRMASCEKRIDGVYDRMAKLERERRRNRDQRKRLTRVVFLWVCLVSLFVIVWTFLGPGRR